jgi:MFS family permease
LGVRVSIVSSVAALFPDALFSSVQSPFRASATEIRASTKNPAGARRGIIPYKVAGGAKAGALVKTDELIVAGRVGHPAAFLFLCFPFGASSGYLVVTLAYLLGQHGVDAASFGGVVALSYIPQTWKFVWAPVVDTTLSRRAWHVIGTALTGLAIAATGFVPIGMGTLSIITAFVIAQSFASTISGMAADSLAAHASDQRTKGRAAGWLQAGNLGGQGIGGGAALWIAQHSGAPWIASASLGALCMACSLAVLATTEIREHSRQDYLASVVGLGKDVWSVAISRMGILAIFILFLPIGTGAASNLWSNANVAGDWHATADTVALVNGALAGVATMISCLIGGYVCDAMDRKAAYALFGILSAACAAGMALAPRTQMMFVVFTLAYNFVLGFCYAGFSAVTLEAIGGGAGATKYNLLASLSNTPIAYMTLVDGWAQKHYGSGGMLNTEAGIGVAAVVLFAAVAWLANRFRPPVAAAA